MNLTKVTILIGWGFALFCSSLYTLLTMSCLKRDTQTLDLRADKRETTQPAKPPLPQPSVPPPHKVPLPTAGSVKIGFFVYDDVMAERLISYPSDAREFEQGDWIEAGYQQYFRDYLNSDIDFLKRAQISGALPSQQSSCASTDADRQRFTTCMVLALVHASELHFARLGLSIKFQVSPITFSNFSGFDLACGGAIDCIRQAAYVFDAGREGFGQLNVLLLPIDPSKAPHLTQGHTIAPKALTATNKTTIALMAAKTRTFALMYLFQHEITHAMGFAGHLSDADFTFNESADFLDCPTIIVRSYPSLVKSGAMSAPSCRHNTFVGGFTQGLSCISHSKDRQDFFGYSYNDPLFEPVFKQIFSCWLRYNSIH